MAREGWRDSGLFAIGHRVFYVWLRNAISFRRFVLTTFIASIGEPLLYLVAMGLGIGSFMGLIDGKPYLNFIAPGLVVSAAMFSAAFECTYSSMVRMTIEKVVNAQVVTPVSVEEVIAGEILWGTTRGIISGAIMMAMLMLFGVAGGWSMALLLPLTAAVAFLFASMSMVVTAFARNFDFFTYYLQLFISPMFFFSGIFFPLSAFPAWVGMVAQLLPLTHAVAIARAAVGGTAGPSLAGNAAALLIPAVILFLYALRRMKVRLVK